MIGLKSIEEIKGLTEEYERLKVAHEALINFDMKYLTLSFSVEQDVGLFPDRPMAKVLMEIDEAEFGACFQLAQRSVKRDLASISDRLRELGVDVNLTT